MSHTTKPLSERDHQQTLRSSYNDVDASLQVSGFLTGKVGHRVEVVNFSATVDDISFYDNAVLLYTLRITYNNSDHDALVSAERTV